MLPNEKSKRTIACDLSDSVVEHRQGRGLSWSARALPLIGLASATHTMPALSQSLALLLRP
jgi:hypothetical protein